MGAGIVARSVRVLELVASLPERTEPAGAGIELRGNCLLDGAVTLVVFRLVLRSEHRQQTRAPRYA